MANKTLFALMFLCSYALVPCILGLESVALVALWLKNPFNQRNPRLMKYLPAYKAALHMSRVLYKSTLFMQNKPNLPDAQMKVSSVLTKDYENKSNWKLGENKPNSKPIKANQSQYKANTNPKQTQFQTRRLCSG